MDEVQIGIVGSGFMGKTHAEAFKNYTIGARVVAITGGQRAPELAKEYGVDYEPTLESLLKRENVDAVVIATPQNVHAQQAIAAAKAGKHILLEKPMAVTIQECKAIRTACEQAGVKLMLAFTQRYRRANIEAKKVIDAGKIGKIKMIRETMIGVNGLSIFPKWQRNSENLGTLLGYGVHSIDRIRWLSGSEVSWVAGHSIYPAGIEAEYSSMAVMGLENNISASLLCDMECPSPGYPNSAFKAWVIGSEGILDIDAYGELKLGIDGKWERLFVQEPIDWVKEGKFSPVRMQSFGDQDQEFINAILQNRLPAISGLDGEKAVEVALAVYQSSTTQSLIKLNDFAK
ncbi:MAG: gfo/Idh/MocA family oxidoreductase [Calditrichaeota bacterium]|nr:MAG: gfo/Idh/MocA family oxidoreductase [Calditrichota bacterium]